MQHSAVTREVSATFHPRTETGESFPLTCRLLRIRATLSLSEQARSARNGGRLLFHFMSFLACVDVFRMTEEKDCKQTDQSGLMWRLESAKPTF